MVNQNIVKYLAEGRKRGFTIERLKQELLKGGFLEKDIDEAMVHFNQQEAGKVVSEPAVKIPAVQGVGVESEGVIAVKGETLGLFSKIGKAIVHPVELFEKTKGERVWPALLYLWVVSVIPLIIGSVFIFLAMNVFFTEPLLSPYGEAYNTAKDYIVSSVWTAIGAWALCLFIIGPILLFVSAGILHLVVKIFKGQGGYSDTFGVMVYSMTPSLLFFFVPIVGVWSFILSLFGLSVRHSFTKLRAFLAMLVLWVFSGLIYGIYYLISLLME